MENAGLAAYRVLSSVVDLAKQKSVVFCGSGSNGGDGLVVARLIHSAGGDVQIVLMSDSSKFAAASAVNYGAVEALGLPSFPLETSMGCMITGEFRCRGRCDSGHRSTT